LTAFEGGIDFNRDRLEPVRMTFHGAPLVDTHCQVTGPVAGDLLATFLARWTDHPESAALDRAAGKLIATAADTAQPADPDGGRLIVQLGRTFGGRDLLGGGPPRYAFAPQGEATARKLIRHAIQQAKRFIYIEDQYFVSMEASQLLRETLAKNKLAHITIVLPHHDIGDMPLMCERRRAAIKNLKADSPEKVRIFHRSFPGQPTDFDKDNRVGGLNTYVHSKLIIIDDEFASIGSVNFNRRSWTHDSEATLAIYDPASDAILTSRFVRWLRIRIWANQLFGVPRDRRPNPPGKAPREIDRLYAELHDGVAAGALWNGLIQLRDDAFRKSPPDKKQKDGGFDQAQTIGDLVAQEALVRPYDEDDPPLEVFGGDVLFLGPIVGVKKATVQALTGLDPDAFFDTIVDPST
jgi:phosphatidylserine/phosphatidylglycerophosphate/cardiolipin synthase-like enzyme